MAHSHIGHDAEIGSYCEISTGSIIGGYAKIEDGAKLKLNVTIRNRKTVGGGALIGMGAVVVSDIPPGQIFVGNPAKAFKNNENNS
jgi:acetyltransferase-like isoleucine patch superfamily enzyme